MEENKSKKPWIKPEFSQIEIHRTENGGGYGQFDIAFQDTDNDIDLMSQTS